MMQRTSARDRLLKAAAELFYEQGVSATGIDTITAHAGVAKMSLYNNFASKADLVAAYIEARHAAWQERYRKRASRAHSPRERILAVFDSYADYAAGEHKHGFRGCGLFNAAVELPIGDPGRAAVARQKEAAEGLIREALQEMYPGDRRAVQMAAEHLSYLLEGAMSRAGLDGHGQRLDVARRLAGSFLDQLAAQLRAKRAERPAAARAGKKAKA